MGGGALACQQASGGQQEGARADGCEARAAAGRCAQRFDELPRNRSIQIRDAGDDDGVGSLELGQVETQSELEVLRVDDSRDPADLDPVGRLTVGKARAAQYFAGRGQVEGQDAVGCDDYTGCP